jgi:TonB dependent receptor
VRIADAETATKDVTVPLGLTNDRSAAGIANAVNNSFCNQSNAPSYCPFLPTMVSTQASNLLNAKLPNGQYLIPSAQITNPTQATTLGYDAVVQGPNQSTVDQGIASIDYAVSDKDRLSARYYIQSNPTTNPFGAVGSLLGFQQQLSAGSQVVSLTNTVVMTPSLTWEQHMGFTRLKAYAGTGQEFSPSQIGINLLGSKTFPQLEINLSDPTVASGLQFGPSPSFGNAGMFQNQWEFGSSMNAVEGPHTISFGFVWDHTQLNVINHNTDTDNIFFTDFGTFAEGQVRGGTAFSGTANRYYRSDTVGVYANDNYKIRKNLTLTFGLRWDFDGPLSEKYGRLTAFDPSKYNYVQCKVNGVPADPATTSYLSPSAGCGFNGSFGVTLAPPFVQPISAPKGATLDAPFGTTPPPPPPNTAAGFLAYLPNLQQTACGFPGCWPTGNLYGPFVFGGYDIKNKLPYTQNWTLDLQYQPTSSWLFDIGYVAIAAIT